MIATHPSSRSLLLLARAVRLQSMSHLWALVPQMSVLALGLGVVIVVSLIVSARIRALVLKALSAIWRGAGFVLGLTRYLSASVVRQFDRAIPIDTRNGQLPSRRFGIWLAANVLIVIVWLGIPVFSPPHMLTNTVGFINLLAAIINIVFLTGSAWALREEIAIMNGDQPPTAARFAELSTAKSIPMLGTAAFLAVFQIAATLQFLEQVYGIAFLTVIRSLGIAYADFLLGTLSALPFVSFVTAILHLSKYVAFTSFDGTVSSAVLNALGSVLIVSTIIGFVQMRAALRTMVNDLLLDPHSDPGSLLGQRFLRAPSIVKRYLRIAFDAAGNDKKKLAIVKLAVDKCAYSFPQSFLARYGDQSQRLRGDAMPLLVAFVEDQSVHFDRETLLGIVGQACTAYWKLGKGKKKQPQRRLLGRLLLAALERWFAIKDMRQSTAQAAIRVVQNPAVQYMLAALMDGADDGDVRKRAQSTQDQLRQMVRSGR